MLQYFLLQVSQFVLLKAVRIVVMNPKWFICLIMTFVLSSYFLVCFVGCLFQNTNNTLIILPDQKANHRHHMSKCDLLSIQKDLECD